MMSHYPHIALGACASQVKKTSQEFKDTRLNLCQPTDWGFKTSFIGWQCPNAIFTTRALQPATLLGNIAQNFFGLKSCIARDQ